MYKTIFKGLLCLLIISSCKNTTKENTTTETQEEETLPEPPKDPEPIFELSLAQWSLHKEIQSGKLDPMDFSEKAKELGFTGIEYVSQLYTPMYKDADDPEKELQEILNALKTKSDQHNVQNLLIMVDGEGDLAVLDEKERNQTVENHKKWVDAAQFLGCHSIRVNLFGTNDPEKWVEVATDGLKKLSTYAATKSINVIVENHGYLSSDASLLVKVMQNVNMKNCGTLPDFGNFCLEREGGERWGAKCVKEYPKYKGIEEMMPFAKGVSAKSYDFDADGNETTIDYKKMLDIIKAAGYQGYIGVEYEGSRLSELDGIIATRDLLIKLSK
ncbi:sugar phosphate isomerase/epimerase family protein [Aquimarina litoralis]|uniref:sugar phosphate isomerase/epimerase family protein n=1 Tax=Aquimarina litoralis TaxID=584605 RepID=UPI001C57CAED|nr:sugar phosphate isomerase/epimerase family protein [Aquimarina litoralis]MBW1298172.1 TIM barrel protein [Aquimarina litoralis]